METQTHTHIIDNSDAVAACFSYGLWVVRMPSSWVSRGKEMLEGGVCGCMNTHTA